MINIKNYNFLLKPVGIFLLTGFFKKMLKIDCAENDKLFFSKFRKI